MGVDTSESSVRSNACIDVSLHNFYYRRYLQCPERFQEFGIAHRCRAILEGKTYYFQYLYFQFTV